MSKEREKPAPEPAPEVRDDPRVVAHRCPFCHEPVRPDEDAWVACAQCLGRQHAACWDEAGRCAACRHDQRLEAPARTAPAARRRGRLGPVHLTAIALVLVTGALSSLLVLRESARVEEDPIASLDTRRTAEALWAEPPTEALTEPVVAGGGASPGVQIVEPSPPTASPAARLASLQDAEHAFAAPAERARLLGAEGPAEADGEAVTTPQETFTWLPDDAAAADVARRLVREHRERALERDGEVASQVLLAHVDVFTGNPQQAVTRCERALDRDPRYGPAWMVRGWARRALGDLDGAELDLRRGERLSDDPTWALVGLGRVAEDRGARDEARELYARALEVGGERLAHPVDHAADLRRRLERLGRR